MVNIIRFQLVPSRTICLIICACIYGCCCSGCHDDLSIPVEEGNYTLFPNQSLHDARNNMLYEPTLHWRDEATGDRRVCICLLVPCLRKCCDEGEAFLNKQCTPLNSSLVRPFKPQLQNLENLKVESSSRPVLLIGFPRCAQERRMYMLDPRNEESDKFVVLSNGSLHIPPAFHFDVSNYCLERVINEHDGPGDDSDGDGIVAQLCFPEEPPEPDSPAVYKIGQMVSIPFLAATWLVLACVQPSRNYHRRTLMCYVSSLLIAFMTLSFTQLQLVAFPAVACMFVASLIQFSFLATFFWLNTMCFDIWWTFRKMIFVGGCNPATAKNGEEWAFVISSVYAWGGPFLICVATAYVNSNRDDFPIWLNPHIGVERCWFNSEEDYALIIYFYGPIGILLLLNVLMFGMTTFTICRSARDTKVLKRGDSKRHHENERQRFFLYLKLFVLMGANWIMEVVSWFYRKDSDPAVWYITDLWDILTGVIIFALFVCTRKTLRQISKKLCFNMDLFKESSTKVTSSSKLATSSSARGRTSSVRKSDSEVNGSAISLRHINGGLGNSRTSMSLEQLSVPPFNDSSMSI